MPIFTTRVRGKQGHLLRHLGGPDLDFIDLYMFWAPLAITFGTFWKLFWDPLGTFLGPVWTTFGTLWPLRGCNPKRPNKFSPMGLFSWLLGQPSGLHLAAFLDNFANHGPWVPRLQDLLGAQLPPQDLHPEQNSTPDPSGIA